jgi:hypothetical protein
MLIANVIIERKDKSVCLEEYEVPGKYYHDCDGASRWLTDSGSFKDISDLVCAIVYRCGSIQ